MTNKLTQMQAKSDRTSEQHSFDVQVAILWGIEKAIILKEIAGWCRINERKNHNESCGFYWTYNPAKAYSLHFAYMSEKKTDRLIRELENDGLIFGHKFHSYRGNQTKSHTVNWELYNMAVIDGKYCLDSATQFIEYLSSNLRNAALKNEESSFPKNEESSFPKNEESYTSTSTPTSTPTNRKGETFVSTAPANKKSPVKFIPPTPEEISEAFQENLSKKNILGAAKIAEIAETEAEKFLNHYQANGWKVGKNKMQSWPHAVGGWIARMDQYKTQTNTHNSKLQPDENIISNEAAHRIIYDIVANGWEGL